nr:MAG TPA: hypothetical protein [Bacteriophage sp.]
METYIEDERNQLRREEAVHQGCKSHEECSF